MQQRYLQTYNEYMERESEYLCLVFYVKHFLQTLQNY